MGSDPLPDYLWLVSKDTGTHGDDFEPVLIFLEQEEAIDYVEAQPSVDETRVYGASMGGWSRNSAYPLYKIDEVATTIAPPTA